MYSSHMQPRNEEICVYSTSPSYREDGITGSTPKIKSLNVKRLTKIEIKLYKRDLKRILKKSKNFRTKTFCLSIFPTGLSYRKHDISSTIFRQGIVRDFPNWSPSIGLGRRRTDVETEDSEFDSLSRVT